MNDNERKDFENENEIDLVDFSSNREMDMIRENERIEREKRRRRAAEIRRREIIKLRKRQRIQQMIAAWGIVLLVLLAVIAAIIGIVSLFRDDEAEQKEAVGNEISEQEMSIVSGFSDSTDVIYAKEFGKTYSNLLKDTVIKPYSLGNVKNSISEMSMLTEAYIWNTELGAREELKTQVRDLPMLANGYVWSEEDSMRSSISGSYFYDTHAAFIKAVCEICLWEGDTSFLGQIDQNAQDRKDVSGGMSVQQKLEKAVAYYFDTSDPYGGGIRYNKDDGLVYISTTGNDGTPQGKPSNVFFTFKFGHLDCYNNLLFNDAMVSLSKLYKMMGDEESSEKYSAVAKTNKAAINNAFFDSDTGRYLGYIDKNGNKYDYGFTAVNYLALSLGIADADKAERVMDWLEGTREVSVDTVNKDRLSKDVLPVFSTVGANDLAWDTIGGKYLISTDASYGNFWLNGGNSALSGFFKLKAKKAQDRNELRSYIDSLCNSFENESYKLPDTVINPNSEPILYHCLLSSTAVKEMFGVSSDGKTLSFNPLFGTDKNIGIKGISFARKKYDFLLNNQTVYVFSDTNAQVRIRVGGFKEDHIINLAVIEDNKIVSTEEVKADNNGILVLSKRFGNNSFIRLQRVEKEVQE